MIGNRQAKVTSPMKSLFFYGIIVVLFMGLHCSLNAQTLLSHDFNDGDFGPYEVNKTSQESRVYITDSCVETHWDQTLYDGTNSGRKAQFRPEDYPDYQFTQELWEGFYLKIDSDYMVDNTNTDACLMQIWGHNDETGSENHMAMLQFDGRNGGALCWQHRYNSVEDKTHLLIYSDFPRDQWVKIIIRVKLCDTDNGTVQVWVDDELMLDVTGQTIGWGDMDSTGMINETYATNSFGQYNYRENASWDETYDEESHYFDGHMEGETRTVFYDNVSLWNGTDGYSIVDPGDEYATDEVTSENSITMDAGTTKNSIMSLYPNPVSDELTINIDDLQNATLAIISHTGQVVASGEITAGKGTVNVSGLSVGVYIVKATEGEQVCMGTFIKE
jgi:hypothetical protein